MKTLLTILATFFVLLSFNAMAIDSSDSLRIITWNSVIGGKVKVLQLKGLNDYIALTGSKDDRVVGEMRVLQSFVESFEFSNMKENSSLSCTNYLLNTSVRSFSEPGKQYAIYLSKNPAETARFVYSKGKPIEFKEKLSLKIPEGSYRADWINPKSGELIATEYFIVQNDRHAFSTPKYFIDIALRIIRIL
jgi:hypothetical protein